MKEEERRDELLREENVPPVLLGGVSGNWTKRSARKQKTKGLEFPVNFSADEFIYLIEPGIVGQDS